MSNKKDEKVIRAWDTAMAMILANIHAAPDEDGMEHLHKLSELTEDDITVMAGGFNEIDQQGELARRDHEGAEK